MWPLQTTRRSILSFLASAGLVWPYMMVARVIMGTSHCYTVRPPEAGSIYDACSGENCYYGTPVGCTFELAPWSHTIIPMIVMLVVTWVVCGAFAEAWRHQSAGGAIGCLAVAGAVTLAAVIILWDQPVEAITGAARGITIAGAALAVNTAVWQLRLKRQRYRLDQAKRLLHRSEGSA